MPNEAANSVDLATGHAPDRSPDRISSLDVIRGGALLGILLMNIIGFALPFACFDPTVYGGAEGWNLLAWKTNSLWFEGTMRGLFSLLFGASVVLMMGRAEARDSGIGVADLYFRRNLWLIAFGLVHSWLLLWQGDILYVYGIAGLFLFVFRKTNPRILIVLGLMALASVAAKDWNEHIATMTAYSEAQVVQQLLDNGATLDEEQQAAIDTWQEKLDDAHPPDKKIEGWIAARKSGYFANIAANAEGNVERQSHGLYMYSFWDALGMMFIGMALLRLGVLNAQASTRLYLAMLILGYGVGIAVNYYEMRLVLDSNFDILSVSRSWLTYDAGRLPVTLGHVGLVMLICKLGWMQWLTARVAAVGRMALTSYITHTLICSFIFTGVGLGMFGELQRFELYYVVLGIWVFQLIVSPIWLNHFRFGPLEWLWRSLTYNERQPMKRHTAK